MTTNPPEFEARNDCWNHIGIGGDRSCPELQQVVHCRNCTVFERAARSFFERPAPTGYLEEWSRFLSMPAATPKAEDVSLLVFCLGDEWLAIRTPVIVEVTTLRPVHRIPHRSNSTLVGMVNLRGQLQLLISLHGLLGIEPNEADSSNSQPGISDLRRLIVMRGGGQTWVFAAGNVLGVQRFGRASLCAVPSNLANPAYSYCQSVVLWKGQTVGFLDERRIFTALEGVGQ